MNDLTKYLKYLGGLVALLLVFGSGWFVRDLGARSDMESVLKDHEIELQEIEVVKTKNSTLTKALAGAEDERDVLLDEIASLKSKPAEIRYITKVETVVIGEPTLVTTELPESHTFRTTDGLAVAEFSVEEGENDSPPEYYFDTADLTIKADVVIGERDSAVSLRVESDLEPGVEHEIPVEEFNVTQLRDQKLFEPHLIVGAHVTGGQGGVGAGPHLGVSFFHPRDELDLVQVRIGSTSGGPALGLDPVVYNVGEHLPVLTNVWIGAGVDVNLQGQVGGTLSIGAKL
jgi:hypothetical protein